MKNRKKEKEAISLQSNEARNRKNKIRDSRSDH